MIIRVNSFSAVIRAIISTHDVIEKCLLHYLAPAQLRVRYIPAFYLRLSPPPKHSEEHLTFFYTSALSWTNNWVNRILLGKGFTKGKISVKATHTEKGIFVDRNKKQSTLFTPN